MAIQLTKEQWAILTAPDARMNAYYYSFEKTGNRHIDAMLSSVAYAGKASHHTEQWSEEERDYAYGPFLPDQSYIQVIQAVAQLAADRIVYLENALAKSDKAFDKLYDETSKFYVNATRKEQA